MERKKSSLHISSILRRVVVVVYKDKCHKDTRVGHKWVGQLKFQIYQEILIKVNDVLSTFKSEI